MTLRFMQEFWQKSPELAEGANSVWKREKIHILVRKREKTHALVHCTPCWLIRKQIH